MKQHYRCTGCEQGSTLLGLLIGLVLGIGIAAGVAIYVSHIPNPFAQGKDEGQGKPPPSSIATPDPTASAPKVSKAEPGKASEGTADNKGRFDFYKILPGDENAVGAQAAAAKPSPASAAQPATQAKPTAEGTTYYLQAGAYQTEDDADNQKAKLALLGLEAQVRTATLKDKGTIYRVRLGPFASQEEVNDTKTTLQENGITASVIKIVKATGN
jgi:cell division protein FtsN